MNKTMTMSATFTVAQFDHDAWAYQVFNMSSGLGLTDPELYERLCVEGSLA